MSACVGPLIPLPSEEGGSTSTGREPEDDDEDEDESTSTTSSTASATVTPGTTGPTSLTTPPTATATMTEGPIDDCVDLEILGGLLGPGLTAGTTIGATNDFQFCQAGGDGGPSGGDYVISWTAATSALYHFTLAGSDYDTVLGVFPPACGSDPYACNDDCQDVSSSVDWFVNAGEEVYVVVAGFQGHEGNFVLNIGSGPNDCFGGSTSGYDSGDFISTGGE